MEGRVVFRVIASLSLSVSSRAFKGGNYSHNVSIGEWFPTSGNAEVVGLQLLKNPSQYS